MNIHLVDSLAPMQSAPLDRPNECPACGETKFTDKHPRNFEHRIFECGAYYEFENKKWWGECKRAFAAAVSLRVALDAECSDVAELRAELDAARAEVAETKRMYSQDNAHWYCPFCQKDVYMPTPLSIKEHTLVCVGHPMRGVEKKRDSALARAAELQARLGAVTDAAQELVDIFQGLIDGDKFVYDSFTLQPMRAALAAPAREQSKSDKDFQEWREAKREWLLTNDAPAGKETE